MALPVVTAKQYDYGQYANPTMVKYKGGQEAIGAAIGQTVQAGIEAYTQTRQKVKAADDWKSNEVYELYTAVPADVVASNEEGIKILTDNMGELGKLKALGRISGEEYNKRMIPLKRTYDAYMILGTDLYNAIGDQPLDLTKYKGKELNSAAGLHRAISSGALEIKFDPKTGQSIASWTGADDKEKFSTDLVDLTVNSKKYLKLNERYDINSADNQKIFSDAAKVLNQNNFVDNFMKNVINTAEGSKAALDKQGLVNALADLNNSFINPIVEQNGKDIFEDIIQQIKPSLKFESDEAKLLIRGIVASQIADKTKQVGDKIPEPKASETIETPKPSYNFAKEVISTMKSAPKEGIIQDFNGLYTSDGKNMGKITGFEKKDNDAYEVTIEYGKGDYGSTILRPLRSENARIALKDLIRQFVQKNTSGATELEQLSMIDDAYNRLLQPELPIFITEPSQVGPRF